MEKLLKKYFGYDEFRPLQKEIIQNTLDGKDSFVLMPTGGGKSLCYQLPALKFDGITLVISPLIALMKDQVDNLLSCGIKAEFINSTLSPNEINDISQRCLNKEVKILYIAPERLALPSFQEFLNKLDISLIAIDEAHCISEWGHDFRPDYGNLSQLKKIFPGVPLMALTATATEKVREDILYQLEMKKSQTFLSSFNRENLNISVIEKKQAFSKLVNILDRYKNKSVIIYCFSRNDTEDLEKNLKLNGFSARAYHAGLSPEKRKKTQELFIKDKVNIIAATIAFGMGIDKPDVRLVVHYSFPKTLEGYYQEIGRAGRDGLPSECVMFYTYADTRKHNFFINQIYDNNLQKRAQEKLDDVLNFCELSSCRKKHLLAYFGEELKEKKCGNCDMCLVERETIDASEITKKILSAIIRTDNRFGRNYIIDLLLGKKIQRIKRNSHDSLSVFGIVKNYEENELSQIINQLIELGLISKTIDSYPILKITKKGANFLDGNKKLEIEKPKIDIITNKAIKKSKNNIDYNNDLYEELRTLRTELAEENNVPPFIIFGDKSLQEMAHYLPEDKENFSKISGVGTKKLETFGNDFLSIIAKFKKNNKLESKSFEDTRKEVRLVKTAGPNMKYYTKTKELLFKKIPLKRIAKLQDVKIPTIVNHIEKILDNDEKLDLEYLKLPLNKYRDIETAFLHCGTEKLKPAFEFLDGKYDYDDIRIVRVLMDS